MDLEAQIVEETIEDQAEQLINSQRIKNSSKNKDLKCNVCGKSYENVNNLKVNIMRYFSFI